MGKFKKKVKASQELPTSALPDIIFMLLFFFMVSTVMRESTLKVEQTLTAASQLRKVERKTLVSYIYVGKPIQKLRATFGDNPRIQVNDNYTEIPGLVPFVEAEKISLGEEANRIIISMKVDKGVEMGLVTDIQEELKEANARKVLYNAPTDSEADQ